MHRIKKLEVFYHDRLVGTMALYQNRLAAFEYGTDWLADGFSINPFSLPLEKKVFLPSMIQRILAGRNMTTLYVQRNAGLIWRT